MVSSDSRAWIFTFLTLYHWAYLVRLSVHARTWFSTSIFIDGIRSLTHILSNNFRRMSCLENKIALMYFCSTFLSMLSSSAVFVVSAAPYRRTLLTLVRYSVHSVLLGNEGPTNGCAIMAEQTVLHFVLTCLLTSFTNPLGFTMVPRYLASVLASNYFPASTSGWDMFSESTVTTTHLDGFHFNRFRSFQSLQACNSLWSSSCESAIKMTSSATIFPGCPRLSASISLLPPCANLRSSARSLIKNLNRAGEAVPPWTSPIVSIAIDSVSRRPF